MPKWSSTFDFFKGGSVLSKIVHKFSVVHFSIYLLCSYKFVTLLRYYSQQVYQPPETVSLTIEQLVEDYKPVSIDFDDILRSETVLFVSVKTPERIVMFEEHDRESEVPATPLQNCILNIQNIPGSLKRKLPFDDKSEDTTVDTIKLILWMIRCMVVG